MSRTIARTADRCESAPLQVASVPGDTAESASTGNAPTWPFTFAALAHEVQGRLSSISILAEQIRVEAENGHPPQAKDRLGRICQAATELQGVLDAIKRFENGSLPQRVLIDVSALSAKVFQRRIDHSPTLGRAKIRIQSGMLMMSDPSEIEIVLDNLIGNSLKFSAPRDAPEIRITAGLDSGDMVVHVSDNGVGITADDLCRIFEPFTRCHPGFQGSGLGLTLARHIVVRHGGRIWATGESGHGTTISFSS